MKVSELLLRIKAESTGVEAALGPVITDLHRIEESSEDAERALDRLSNEDVEIMVRLAGIEKTKAEILEWRRILSEDAHLGVTVDTQEIVKEITRLRAQLRALGANEIDLQLRVEKQQAEAEAAKAAKDVARAFDASLAEEAKRSRGMQDYLALQSKAIRENDTITNLSRQKAHEVALAFDDAFAEAFHRDRKSSIAGRIESSIVGVATSMFEIGARSGIQFIDGFSTMVGRLPPEIQAIVLGALPLIAGALAAALNGALLGVAGLSGLTLGIIGAIQDPRVMEAWSAELELLFGRISSAASPFLEPVSAMIATIGDHLVSAVDKLSPVFAALAPVMNNFTVQASKFVDIMGASFADTLGASIPVLNQIANSLPMLAKYIALFFKELSLGSKGGGEALQMLIMFLGTLLVSIGAFLLVASKLVEWIIDAAQWFDHLAQKINNATGNIGKIGTGMQILLSTVTFGIPLLGTLADEIEGGGEVAKGTEGAVRGYAGALRTMKEDTSAATAEQARLAKELEAVEQAAEKTAKEIRDFFKLETQQQIGFRTNTLDVAQGWLDIAEAVKTATHTLDTNTQAGIDNQRMILLQVDALQRSRDDTITRTGDIAAATKAFNDGLANIQTKMSGFGKDAVAAILAPFKTLGASELQNIRVAFANDANPDILAEKLIEAFGPGSEKIIKDIELQVNTEKAEHEISTKTKAILFGMDQELLAAVQKKVDASAAGIPVKVNMDPGSTATVTAQLNAIKDRQDIKPSVYPVINGGAFVLVETQLTQLARTRLVQLIPWISDQDIDKIRTLLASLGRITVSGSGFSGKPLDPGAALNQNAVTAAVQTSIANAARELQRRQVVSL